MQAERADALARYRGLPLGNEEDGKSQVVDRSIADCIEWIMPSLIRIYMGGDDIGKFEARNEQDEEAAQQETDVISWYLTTRNDLFSQINATLSDALLLKNGYTVGIWKTNTDVVTETYLGKSEEEVALLMQDAEVEIVEHTDRLDDVTGMPVHDVKVERKTAEEYVAVESVPPDEMVTRLGKITGGSQPQPTGRIDH